MQLVSASDVPTGAVAVTPLGRAFEDFYDAEYRGLARLGFVLTGSRSVAEELVQETMLRAYRHWRTVSAYDKPGAWARRVLCNLATSRGRRLQAEARALVRLRGNRPEDPQLRPETAELWQAIRTLPARQAQVVTLFYLEDNPIAEIAEMLEMPGGTVKALLHRARAALAQRLGETPEEES